MRHFQRHFVTADFSLCGLSPPELSSKPDILTSKSLALYVCQDFREGMRRLNPNQEDPGMTTTFPQLLLEHDRTPDAPACAKRSMASGSKPGMARNRRPCAIGLPKPARTGKQSGRTWRSSGDNRSLRLMGFLMIQACGTQCPFRCTRMPWPPRCAL